MIHFTNSKGERLPKDINKVANRYYDGIAIPNLQNEVRLRAAFAFDNTDEGHDVWYNVWYSYYQQFYDYHSKSKQARKAEIIAEIEKLQNELKEL